MLNRMRNFGRISALLLVKLLFLSGLIGIPAALCTSRVVGQTNSSMTTEKHYKLEQGEIISNDVQNGSALIDNMLAAASALSVYSADYKMKVYKDRQILNEEGTFYFSKPKLLRMEVKQGARKGSVALLAKDGKVHGHLGGLMKYFNGTVPIDSDMAKAINGFPMADTDFYSLASYLKNMLKQGDLSLCSIEAKQTDKTNEPALILDVYSSIKPSKKLLLKRIYVNSKTYLPVYWEDYIDGKIWSEAKWQNIHANLKLSENFFRL